MATLRAPRIILAGSGSEVGKSLIGQGMTFALRRRGLGVTNCVVGPLFSQALSYRRLSGRYARIVDSRLLSAPQYLETMIEAQIGSELILIDGRGGLLDGPVPGSLTGTDAEVAAVLKTPVVLVIDAGEMRASVAMMVRGYQSFARGARIGGVIINRVRDYEEGKAYFEELFDATGAAPLIGVLPRSSVDAPPSERESLQKRGEEAPSINFYRELGDLVERYVDLDSVIEIAASAEEIESDFEQPTGGRRCRIAVSDDSCFGVCFQDNLDILRHLGAELVGFSPITDGSLPNDIGAIYLTGAYLHEYVSEIARNRALLEAIYRFGEEGGVIYAEGAGAALLCDEVRFPSEGNVTLQGVGLINVGLEEVPGRPEYVELVSVDHSIIGTPGTIAKGISTNEYRAVREGPTVRTLGVSRDRGGSTLDGYSPYPQTLACLSFLHFGSNREIPQSLVEAAEIFQRSRMQPEREDS